MEAMTSTSSYESLLEARIAALEALLLGTGQSIDDSQRSTTSSSLNDPSAILTDINASISRLVDKTKSKIPQSTLEDILENERLERELHPGPYLTHQSFLGAKSLSDYNKPLLYQREEILASSKQFQNSLDQLGKIQELVSLSVTSSSNIGAKGSVASTRDYTNAPIIASDRYAFCIDAHVQDRMGDVTHKVTELLQRADKIAYRVDSLVGRYHKIMSVVSEKIVLLDEELTSRENFRSVPVVKQREQE